MSGIAVTAALAKREIVRFARQPGRVIAAIGMPLLIWAWLGSGLAEAMRPDRADAVSWPVFLLPGIMTLVVVFASMLTSISTIEDRQQGWMQSVLVSPASPWSIAAGKVIGGAAVAWAQTLLLLAVAWAMARWPVLDVLLAAAALAIASIAVTALGLAFAWRAESTASFHAVMNLVFMPMWLLSSAVFPPEGAASWVRVVMRLNPVSWCTDAVRAPLTGADALVPWLPAAAFAAVTCAAAAAVIGRQR